MCGCSPGRQTLSQPVSLSERPTANCATICYVPQTEKDWIPNHFRNTWQGHMRRLIKLQIESRRRQKGHGTTETDSWDGECPRGRHRCTDHTLAKISLPSGGLFPSKSPSLSGTHRLHAQHLRLICFEPGDKKACPLPFCQDKKESQGANSSKLIFKLCRWFEKKH